MEQLDYVTEKQERQIMYSQAIVALTGLYQLHGCQWALAPLAELYQQADCPDLHLGYSADGRLQLRIERLVLQNPAYTKYAIYLCTLEGNTSLNLEALETGSVRFVLDDGNELLAEAVDAAHPLWPQLQRLATTFVPTTTLAAGNAHTFKQVFALQPGLPAPGAPNGHVQAVSLLWGRYSLELPYFGNEVQLDR